MILQQRSNTQVKRAINTGLRCQSVADRGLTSRQWPHTKKKNDPQSYAAQISCWKVIEADARGSVVLGCDKDPVCVRLELQLVCVREQRTQTSSFFHLKNVFITSACLPYSPFVSVLELGIQQAHEMFVLIGLASGRTPFPVSKKQTLYNCH